MYVIFLLADKGKLGEIRGRKATGLKLPVTDEVRRFTWAILSRIGEG